MKKIYCSELVAKAYAYASGLPVEDIFSHRSAIEDSRTFQFAKLVGVAKKEYLSPGDLFNTDQFEVVAEYRKPQDLARAWHLYLMGDVFLERIQKDHKVSPNPLLSTAPMVAWMAQLLPSIFHEDARLIPKSVGPFALSVMAATELHIYRKAIRRLERYSGENQSLFHLSPWEMRAELDRAMDTHSVIKITFHKDSTPKKRPKGFQKNR